MAGKKKRSTKRSNPKSGTGKRARIKNRSVKLRCSPEKTRRKSPEKKIRHLSSFPHLNPNPVLAVDYSGKVVFYNPATERILKSLGMGRNKPSVFLPADIERVVRDLRGRDEATCYREVTLRDRVFGESIHHASQFDNIRIYATDITGHKQAEHAMQEALRKALQHEAEVTVLYSSSREVMEQREFRDTARSIFNSCKTLLGAAAGYVALLSEDGTNNEVLFLDSGGFPCSVDPSLPMPIRGLRETTYSTGRVAFDNDFSGSVWMKYMPEGHTPLDNVLFAPLVISGKTVGLLGLGNKPGGFTEHDASLASTFGDLAAIALYNSRLFELLISSEEKYRTLVNNAPVGVYSTNLTGEILYVNRALSEMFDYDSPEEVMSGSVLRLYKNVKDRDRFIGVLKEKGRLDNYEIEIITKTGKTKYVLLNASLTGDILRGMIIDITERKQNEEELKKHRGHLMGMVEERTSELRMAYEALEQEIRERKLAEAEAIRSNHLAGLGELAASVAHEINNPVNGIVNYAQLLLSEFGSDRKEHDIADRIIKEGRRIENIARNLLSFARVRKDEKRPVKIHTIISDSLSLTERYLGRDGINLTVNVSPDLPEVVAQPQQIQQVFLNVLSNARYALNEKYPGKHTDKIIEIAGEEIIMNERTYVRIIFHDRGSGIPSDKMDKVMNPFFSTKPGEKGTGLGLSISNGIIRDHGGTIGLESVEGEFTRVFIALPVDSRGNE